MASHGPVRLSDPSPLADSKDVSPEIYAGPENGADDLESGNVLIVERIYRSSSSSPN